MGLSASVRNAFSRNTLAAATFAAAAAALPFSNAAAQTRAVPITARPGVTAPVARATNESTARKNDASLQAQLHSAGNASVGVFINVREDARLRRITGHDIGREIVDSLRARGVPAKYFFQDTSDGPNTLISIFINSRRYTNQSGDLAFRPRDISREFDGIKAKYISTPMTAR